MNKLPEKPECRRCKHFYVTWDQDFPNGCKVYGIKSKKLPCVVVKENSGVECQGYEPKNGEKKNGYGF